MFKKIIIAAAFVTVIAAPAFAQSFNPEDGTGNVLPFAYAPTDHSGNNAYARSSANSAYAEHSAKSSYAKAPVATDSESMDVINNGEVVGRDPDPFIRLMLKHESDRGQG
jgi:hypothetical protein